MATEMSVRKGGSGITFTGHVEVNESISATSNEEKHCDLDTVKKNCEYEENNKESTDLSRDLISDSVMQGEMSEADDAEEMSSEVDSVQLDKPEGMEQGGESANLDAEVAILVLADDSRAEITNELMNYDEGINTDTDPDLETPRTTEATKIDNSKKKGVSFQVYHKNVRRVRKAKEENFGKPRAKSANARIEMPRVTMMRKSSNIYVEDARKAAKMHQSINEHTEITEIKNISSKKLRSKLSTFSEANLPRPDPRQSLNGPEDGVILLVKELQSRIGLLPHVEIDWIESAPVFSVTVGSKTEISRVIRATRTLKLRLRGAGTLHSFQNTICDAYSVAVRCNINDEENLTVETEMKENHEKIVKVTVKAGVNGKEFNEFCLANNACLPTMTDVNCISMVGLITTASHGCSSREPPICDFVVKMRIVDSEGIMRTYEDDGTKTSRDLLNAARCSLGLFGIIYDVTFKMHPLYMARITTYYPTVRDSLLDTKAMSKLIQANESIEIFWFPFNSLQSSGDLVTDEEIANWEAEEDEIFIRCMNRKRVLPKRKHDQSLLPKETNFRAIMTEPRRTPKFAADVHAFHRSEQPDHTPAKCPLPWAINWMQAPPPNSRHPIQVHYNFDPLHNLSALHDLVVRYKSRLQSYAERGLFPINIIGLYVRFGASAEAILSPSRTADGDMVCTVQCMSVRGTAGSQEFMDETEVDWRSNLPGARPHWGLVRPDLSEDTIAHTRSELGEDLVNFKRILAQSAVDTDGMFFNDLTFNLLEGHNDEQKALYRSRNQRLLKSYKLDELIPRPPIRR